MAESTVLVNRPQSSSSPPPNCAICLGTFSNKCFSDSCMHEFCFKCLLEWSKIKPECPLCKKAFKVIIHSVKSSSEYDEHVVERPATNEIHIIDNEEFTYELPWRTAAQQPTRFHFRTTFTVDTRGEHAIQQMLLTHPLTNGSHIDLGGYPISSSIYHRRRGRDNTSTSFRRSIYTRNLWVNSSPDISGHYRDISPGFYRSNPGARTRLVPWLNRELNALLYENTQLVRHVVDIIMEHLFRYHICSIAFRSLLFEYLDSKTDHFIHEFYSFMRSPFDMIGYDRHVIYTERPPTPLLLLPEDESSDSDVIIVGSSNPQQPVVINLVDDSDSDEPILVSQNVPMPAPVPHVCPPPTVLDSSSPAPDNGRTTVLDSSSTGSEVTEVKEERKPLLPLKLRLKRKRQSREMKNRLRRKKTRTGRSRSSSSSSFRSKLARDGSSSTDTSCSEDSHKRHKKRRKPKKSSLNKRSQKYHHLPSDKHVDVVNFEYSSTSSSSGSSSDSDTDNMPLSTFSSRDKKKSTKIKEIFSKSYTPPRSYTPPFISEGFNVNQSEPGYSRNLENHNDNSTSREKKKHHTQSVDDPQSTTPPLHTYFRFPSVHNLSDHSNHTNPLPYVEPANDKWSPNIKSDSESSTDDCPLRQLLCKVKKKPVPFHKRSSDDGHGSPSGPSNHKPCTNDSEKKDSQWKGVVEGPSTSNGGNYKPRLNNIVLRKEEQSDMWYTHPPSDSESSDY